MPSPQKQPLSAWKYSVISGIGLFAAIAAFLYFTNTLTDTHRNEQFFYLILILVGLGTGCFLFGAMRSYAVLNHKELSGGIELGGPVVVAALVVVGAYILAPANPDFNIKVQVKPIDGKISDLKGSKLWITDLDLKQKVMETEEMQVDFINIPSRYIGKTIKFGFKSTGYELSYSDSGYILQRDAVIELPIQRDKSLAEISGLIFDEHNRLAPGVIVMLGTTGLKDTTAEDGVFRFNIPGRLQRDSFELVISKQGYHTQIGKVYPGSSDRPQYKLILPLKF